MLLVLAVDQATKLWVLATLDSHRPVQILGDFLQFTLVYNYGGAMGTQFGSSTAYLIIALGILPFLGYYIYRNRHDHCLALPLAFIAGGALGNLVDRIRLGKVVDFIDVDFFDIPSIGLDRWWTFNVADSAISCAIVFLIIYMFFGAREDQEKGTVTAPDSSGENPLT